MANISYVFVDTVRFLRREIKRIKQKIMLEEMIVYQKAYDLLFWIKPAVERFARVHRYSLGVELEKEALELLKSIARLNIKKDKKGAIEECFVCLEIVKILIRLSKDFKLINIKQYEYSSELIVEIEKMLFGLKKRFY